VRCVVQAMHSGYAHPGWQVMCSILYAAAGSASETRTQVRRHHSPDAAYPGLHGLPPQQRHSPLPHRSLITRRTSEPVPLFD